MNDALVVRRFHRIGHLREERKRFFDGDRTLLDALLERFALDELHHQKANAVVFLEAMKGRDARMIQRSKKPRLALEPRQTLFVLRERFGKDFDRDFTTELGVAGAINFAHPARTDEREDLVVTESGSGRQWHTVAP